MDAKDFVIAIICLSTFPVGFAQLIRSTNSYNALSSTTSNEYIVDTSNYQNEYELVKSEDINSFTAGSDAPEASSDEVSSSVDALPDIESNSGEAPSSTTTITMNFAGDCTLGSDSNFGYKNTFFDVFDRQNGNYTYFFENMQSLFANDDLTVVNLEGTFTNNTKKVSKKFNFRAPPEYANILLSGDIELVNLANNHTADYGEIGFNDTIQTLKENNIPYYAYDNYYIYEKDGIKIGFAGLTKIWDGTVEKRINNAIDYFNENNCSAKIITFHWGVEREYKQNSTQQKVGRYAIDRGADLVIGHHSHVIQGIEQYNGKYIVYSLSNFCFGGNTNPPDKDTFVFNVSFEFDNNNLTDINARIYPARVSSVNNKNDYKPTLAEGSEFTRILNKVLKYSNIKAYDDGRIIK